MRSALGEWFWQWRMKLAGRPLREPGCGRCGYPVRGLAGTQCPECGADQNQAGVSHPIWVAPKLRHRLHLVSWSIFVLAGSLALNPFLLPFTPRGLSNHRDYLVRFSSGALPSVNVRHIAYGWGWPNALWIPPRPTRSYLTTREPARWSGGAYYSTEITMTHGGQTYAIVFRHEPDTGIGKKVYEYSGGFGREQMTDWAVAMGADLSRPGVATELENLLRLAEWRSFDAPPSLVGQTTITGGPEIEPARRGQTWLVAAWIAVWAAGFFVMVRRYRRAALPLAR